MGNNSEVKKQKDLFADDLAAIVGPINRQLEEDGSEFRAHALLNVHGKAASVSCRFLADDGLGVDAYRQLDGEARVRIPDYFDHMVEEGAKERGLGFESVEYRVYRLSWRRRALSR